jgi:hypothetical protein
MRASADIIFLPKQSQSGKFLGLPDATDMEDSDVHAPDRPHILLGEPALPGSVIERRRGMQ